METRPRTEEVRLSAGPLPVEGPVSSPPSQASRKAPRRRRSCQSPRVGFSRWRLRKGYRIPCLSGVHQRTSRVIRANARLVLARVTLGWYLFRSPTRNVPLPGHRPHKRGAGNLLGPCVRRRPSVCLRARWPARRPWDAGGGGDRYATRSGRWISDSHPSLSGPRVWVGECPQGQRGAGVSATTISAGFVFPPTEMARRKARVRHTKTRRKGERP